MQQLLQQQLWILLHLAQMKELLLRLQVALMLLMLLQHQQELLQELLLCLLLLEMFQARTTLFAVPWLLHQQLQPQQHQQIAAVAAAGS
jgi:hypothetical protein